MDRLFKIVLLFIVGTTIIFLAPLFKEDFLRFIFSIKQQDYPPEVTEAKDAYYQVLMNFCILSAGIAIHLLDCFLGKIRNFKVVGLLVIAGTILFWCLASFPLEFRQKIVDIFWTLPPLRVAIGCLLVFHVVDWVVYGIVLASVYYFVFRFYTPIENSAIPIRFKTILKNKLLDGVAVFLILLVSTPPLNFFVFMSVMGSGN